MDYNECINLGLNGKEPLKLILKGSVENYDNENVGVVSVVYVTNDKDNAEKKIVELNNLKENENI